MSGWNGEQLLPALSYNQTVAAAYAAGFRGNALVDAVAIAKRESGFVPNIYNGNVHTGDNSVGMMQINILGTNFNGIENIIANLTGASSPLSRDQVGQALTDPILNFRVAYTMSNGGSDGFYSWGPYGGQSALRDTDVPSAQAAVNAFLAESSSQQASDIASLHDLNSGSYTDSGSNSGSNGCPEAGSLFSPSWFANRLCQFGFAPRTDSSGGTQAGNEAGGQRAPTVADNLVNSLSGITAILGWITDYHNWVKLGVIAAGTLLILGGIYFAAKGDGTTIVQSTGTG